MPLSELHEQIAREATRFAESELEPHAAAIDAGERAPDLRALGQQGLIAPDLPVEAGGSGADALARTLVLEALARSCASSALAAGIQGLAARLAFQAGDVERARRLAAGEETVALALSERATGDDDLDAIEARFENGTLSGEKNALGPRKPDAILATAREGEARVLVSAESLAALEPGAVRVGLRGLAPLRFRFERTRARQLGSPELARAARDGARALAAPIAAGLASRALDEARRYAMLRQQFGRAIAKFQGVQFLVAQILVAREGCLALARALVEAEARGEPSSELCAAAALEAPASAVRAALDAVQVFGGMGYTREVVAERLLRDALALQALAGPVGGGAEIAIAHARLV